MTTNFRFNNGGTITDFDDVFIPKELIGSGGLWLWGDNYGGRLGGNSTIGTQSSPVQTISAGINWKQVSCADSYTGCIKTDGTLWLWGSGGYGKLGINATTNRSSPVQTISAGTNWKQVACGIAHAAAVKTDGSLWTWGRGSQGELGNNATTNRSSPVQFLPVSFNWKQVSCGDSRTAAIKTDGTLWVTGSNLGNNTGGTASTPVQTVSAGTNWKQVACARNSTMAIKTDGTLWGWGQNSNGELGNGASASIFSPVQTVSATTNWRQVACTSGGFTTAAIKTDGTLWLWGAAGAGILGNNSTIRVSSPVQTIAGGTNWKQVNLGGGNTAAIKTDGTLWAWGASGARQLLDGTLVSKSSPIILLSGRSNWKQITPGDSFMAAIEF